AGPCDHRRTVADCVERYAQELQPLLVGQGRRLAGRAADDDTVGAAVDEVGAELAIALVVDRTIGVERCHGRGQNLAEHARDVTPPPRSPSWAPSSRPTARAWRQRGRSPSWPACCPGPSAMSACRPRARRTRHGTPR